MDEFLEVFGGMRLGTVVLLIAAFIFMWKTYKKVEAYFKDKYEMEAEKEKQMKDILGQVQQYPKWREQSIERQKEFSSEINDLRNTQKEIIQELKDIEERRKKTKRNELRDRLLQSYRYYTSKDKNPLSAESIGGCFPAGRGASCNYGIGKDGRVCLIVDEENRSWCSSSNSNDQRAVTIECASDMKDPYAMTNAVYEKLIELCVDICRRNGKTTLLWFADKNKSLNYEPKANEMVLTVHRWFANKSCPGDWLYSRLGDVASRVTSQLGGSSGGGSNSGSSGSYKTGLYKVNVGDLNIRKGPGTNYGINGVITNKGTYTIVEIKNGSWGRLKSGAGWINISSAYCSYVGATSGGGSSNNGSGSAGSNSKTGTYKVDIPDLYIRKGPGTGYAKNGFCPKGVYTNGYTWGRLKSGAGWIALDYAKKV